jgi:ankyrin repeat protein
MKTIQIRVALLAALATTLAGCSTARFQPGAVRAQMTALCQQHKYQEAREVHARPYPSGDPMTGRPSPEEQVKSELIDTLVNPSEAAYAASRIRDLEAQVAAALSQGKDEDARQAIHAFGITPTRQRAVDAAVYLAKCAYLNSRVNPATLARWERFAAKYVDGSLQSGDYPKAIAAAKRIGLAAAYPERIDGILDDAASDAIAQHADAEGAGELAGSFKETLYTLFAPRAGFPNDNYLVPAAVWKDLLARIDHYERLKVPVNGFEPGFQPDWKALERTVAGFRQALVEDDVSDRDADTLAKSLLDGLKALVPYDRNGLTTWELNNRLRNLQSEVQARILKAIAEERAKRLEAEAQAKAAATAERLRELDRSWKALVDQMASAVDFSAREAAITAAISDRLEPAVNRMLGEGARVLRLQRIHGTVTPEQATSLLLAALYMGFDDVANLALALGADVDGTGEKDANGRTPYLFALQYGFKGAADRILAKADPSLRDANNAGAVHYAVRANDAARLRDLLKAGADARTPDANGATPLMLAARLRNPAMASMLLAKSDVDATDSNGRAAVHFAAAAGDLRTLRVLVAGGAGVEAATKDGNDLLTLACAANAEDVIAYLLDELKLPVGERPVTWCVIHGKVLPLKTLVAHGGVLSDRHLAAAAKCLHPDMVRYLVGQGCDVNSPELNAVLRSFPASVRNAPWIDLAGDTTAEIAGTKDSPAAEIFFFLYSQGFRPSASQGGGPLPAGEPPAAPEASLPALPGNAADLAGGAAAALSGLAGQGNASPAGILGQIVPKGLPFGR